MNFLIVALAVWRVTSLLANEDGPFDVLEKFRHLIGIRWDKQSKPYGTNIIARAFNCVWCLSVWTGAIGAAFIAPSIIWYPFYVLALSAATIIVEELITSQE